MATKKTKTKKVTTRLKKKQKKVLKAKPKKTLKKKIKKPAAKAKKVSKARKTVKVVSEPEAQPSFKKESKDLSKKHETLRKFLLQKREEILKEAKAEISKYIKGENRQLVDTALDDGDWSLVDLSEDISLKQLSTHRETLLKIDTALRKITEGTYGICEDCGEEISEERLKVLPFAIYCRDCQERIEQLEAIEKELPI